MPISRWACIAILAVATVALSSLLAAEDAAKPAPTPITLAEIRERGVVGQLGLPLGTLARIEGVVVPAETPGAKGQDPRVRVTHVNGERLAAAVTMEYYDSREAKKDEFRVVDGSDLLKPGDAVVATAYETGGYWGTPDGAPSPQGGRVATRRMKYGFSTRLFLVDERR